MVQLSIRSLKNWLTSFRSPPLAWRHLSFKLPWIRKINIKTWQLKSQELESGSITWTQLSWRPNRSWWKVCRDWLRTLTRMPFRLCRPRTFFKPSNQAGPRWLQRSKKYLKKPRMEQVWTRRQTTNYLRTNKIHRRASSSWLGSPNYKSRQATIRSFRARYCSRCQTNA